MQAQRHWRDHADEFPHDVKTCLLAGEYFHARYGGQYYAKAQNLARRLGHAYDTALTRVDALLMPTVPMRAPRLIDAGAAPDLHVTRALEMNANTAPSTSPATRHVRALRITRRPAGGHDADRPPLRGHAVPRRARLRARARLNRAVSARDGHRVGLLFSRESLTAATEITQENATRMAIDEVNAAGGIDGVPLTPISAGVGAQPPDYRQAAEWLCDAQRVPLIFGSHMSSTRKAVLPVVESRRALLFYATLYEGFEYSPNCFYTGSVPNQNSVQLASYVIRHFGNRVLFIGGQYVYPRESNRIMRELYEQAGGEVVAETYLPLNARQDDLAEVLKRAIALRPDAIYSTMVGRDIVKLYRAYRALGLNPARMPIVSLATNETDVAAMTSEEAEGHITAAPYFATLDSEPSRRFARRTGRALAKTAPSPPARRPPTSKCTWRPTPRRAAASRRRTSSPRSRARSSNAPRPRRHRRRHPAHSLWPRIARVNARREFEIIYAARARCGRCRTW